MSCIRLCAIQAIRGVFAALRASIKAERGRIGELHRRNQFTDMEMKRARLTKSAAMPAALIAPCGMNCRLCRAYVKDKNGCPGCQGDDSSKSRSRSACRIKNCRKIVRVRTKYCFQCDSYPCDRLSHLNSRYRTKYGMSMIQNLDAIRSLGIRRFIENEKKRWSCPECGELLCVHKPQCIHCQHVWRRKYARSID